MTFAQRKLLVLATWVATVMTVGLILTIDKPNLWMLDLLSGVQHRHHRLLPFGDSTESAISPSWL